MEVMAMRRGPILGVVLAAAAVVLLAGVPVGRLVPWLLVLACPLMMLFMHHGGHANHGDEQAEARDEGHASKQYSTVERNAGGREELR